MSIVPMIGEPLEERHYLCEHHKLPKIVPDFLNYNPSIRLNAVSRLRTLGDNNNHKCKDCNESVCSCLWSSFVEKQAITATDEEPSTSSTISKMCSHKNYRLPKGWSIRNQLLEKIKESYIRCKSKQCSTDKKKHLIHSKKSLICLLPPTKKIYRSETNVIMENTKLKASTSRPPSFTSRHLAPYKYQPNLETGICNKLMTKRNWPLFMETENLIPKGKKEYFNERKRRLYSEIERQPMIENELDKSLYRGRKLSITPLQSITHLKDWRHSPENILVYSNNSRAGNHHLALKDPEAYTEKLRTETDGENSISSAVSLDDTENTEVASKYDISIESKNLSEKQKSLLKQKQNSSIYTLYDCEGGSSSKGSTSIKNISIPSDHISLSRNKIQIERNYYQLTEPQSTQSLSIKPLRRGVSHSTQTANTKIPASDIHRDRESPSISPSNSCSLIIDSDELTEKPESSKTNLYSSGMKAKVTTSSKQSPLEIKPRIATPSGLNDQHKTNLSIARTNKSKLLESNKIARPILNIPNDINEKKIILRSVSTLKPIMKPPPIKAVQTVKREIFDLTNHKNAEIVLPQKLLIKQKKLTQKLNRKQTSTTSSQTTITDEVSKDKSSENQLIKNSLHQNEQLKRKSSVTAFLRETLKRRKLRSHVLSPPMKIPSNPCPDVSTLQSDNISNKSDHFVIPSTENQASLVTVSNDAVTYSFHRPVSYEEVYGMTASIHKKINKIL